MNLLEYQAKEVLESCGVRTPRSVVIKTSRDLVKIKERMFPSGYVVKAQVTTGGRGKSGGIKIVKSAKQARSAAKEMLGSKLSTYQSGGAAVRVECVLVAEKIAILREYYLAAVLNRRRGHPVLLISKAGGMEIEQIARERPGELHEVPVDSWTGAAGYKLRRLAAGPLEIPPELVNDFIGLAKKVAATYMKRELFLLEINPLAMTAAGFTALDSKISLDESALFRQPQNQELYKQNLSLLGFLERKAKNLDVSYIPIGGKIGCLVNGAGLAMATMDLLQSHGQAPANFLDVGGGSNKDQMRGAFELLFSDKNLTAIFVNIFGGIVRCDLIAEALIEADSKAKLRVPLVARLMGTNVDKAREILAKAKMSMVQVHADLSGAVKSVCEISKKSNGE
ncbi:MAG: ADP-forming succinate--CoA ligase subunit beta [Elusimicrobia bacterium]|nr:ADP-forming succinate--CoA ligase subunit beta [Elusimicrobiota bacterium]